MLKNIISLVAVTLLPIFTFAQDVAEKSISEKINDEFAPIVKWLADNVFFVKPFAFIGLDIPLVVLW
ncbi:MAG: hypothetical protein JKY42_06035, partial [Flavobacteriales bacterium]|nr:hypothetical protein [Flavobacteriales bacterium]